MRLSRALRLLPLLLLPAGYAMAQAGAAPAEASNVPAEAPLSPQEQLQTAQQYLTSMGEALANVRAALQQAKANRDVVKVLCLNDKFNQIDIASRSARGRVTSLEEAVQSRDTARSRHDFAVLEVLNERVTALVAEANQCVGEEVGFVGEADTTVTVDPELPEPDVDQLGADVGVVLSAPILSSPVL